MYLKLFYLGFFFLLLTNAHLKSQSNYYIFYDNIQSPVMGAEVLATGNYLFSTMENNYLIPKLFPEKRWTGKALNIGYRLTKTFFIDKTWGDFLRVFQHEVFGHGARAREFDFNNVRYGIDFPQGGGVTSYGMPPRNRIMSLEEGALTTMGGANATMLLATTIRNKWLQSREINTSETYLYASSFLSFSSAMRSFRGNAGIYQSDISFYHHQLNWLHRDAPRAAEFTPDFLRKRSLINYANPAVYYSLYVLVKDYIGMGKETVRLPMIRLGEMRYLPMFRLGLSPFGTELYIENFLTNKHFVHGLTLRLGDNIFGKHWGISAKTDRLVNNNWLQLDVTADIWRQPALELGGESIEEVAAGIGGALQAAFHFRFPNSRNAAAFCHLGYKTPGYLEGNTLRGGAFVRWGASLRVSTRLLRE